MSENMAEKHMPIIENDYDSEDFVFVQRNEVLTDKEYADTSYLKDVWSHFKRNKGAVIGMERGISRQICAMAKARERMASIILLQAVR